MKKYLLVISVLACLACFGAVSPAFSEQSTTKETFDSTLSEGWETSPEAVVKEGALQVSPGNFAFRMGEWSNPTITVKIKYAKDNDAMVGYMLHEKGNYAVHLSNDSVRVEKVENDTPEDLATAQLTGLSTGDWVTLEIAVSDGEQVVSVDGEEVIEVTDPDPFSSGAVSLHVEGESIGVFDDFQITGDVPAALEEPTEGEGEGEPGSDMEQPTQVVPDNVGTSTNPVSTPLTTAASSKSRLEKFFNDFFAEQSSNADLTTFIVNLILAVITSYILSLVYIHWGSSLSNRRKFAANFMLMTVTTTFIILIVRSSVALSLGLVGALSIVRFRAAVKEPEELAYLFFTIGLGIGLGDNQRMVTLVALAVAVIVMGCVRLLRRAQADVNLHLTVAAHAPQKLALDQVMGILQKHCPKVKLMRLDETAETTEMSFLVEFRKTENLNNAKAALEDLVKGPMEITFLDNKGIW